VTGRAASGEQRAEREVVSRSPLAARRSLGLALIAGYAIHASVHLMRHEPYDLLWACHIAALLVAFGLLARNANANAIGFLWSIVGNALWILDMATGGVFMPTSVFTHIGAFACGLYGVRRLGMPRFAGLKAIGAYGVLWIVTRLVTPPAPNINLAYRVWSGWEKTFPSYPAYFAMLVVGGTLTFMIGENLFKRIT